MIRFILRLLGVLCLAAAFVAVVVDGTRSIAARAFVVSDLGMTWEQLNGDSLVALQQGLQNSAGVMQDIGSLLLAQPSFAVFGVLGVLFLLLGRRPGRRRVGFAT